MKREMLITCLIGLMAAVGARAADEPPANPTGEHRGMRGGMTDLLPASVLGDLALTADQKTKYDGLDASFKKDLAKWRSSHGPGSESSSGGSTNNVASSRSGLRQVRKGYVDQLRASLTDDQKAKLDKDLENLRNSRGNHGGSNSGGKPSTPPPDNT
jgi:hypothetical protein